MSKFNGSTETTSLEFYIRYLHMHSRGKCYLFVLKWVHDEEIAKDIVLQAFCNIWIRKPDFSSPANAESYLIATARNMCADYLRQTLTIPLDPTLEIANPPEILMKIDAHEMALRYKAIIKEILHALAPAERRILYLKHFKGLKNEQIAAVMNRESVDGIKAQIYSAIMKLRKKFPEYINAWRLLAVLLLLQFQ